MTNPTRAVRETRRFLRQTVKCLQHDATRKLIWIAQYAQKHPVLFILFGIIATPVLTPLVFAFLLMTPAFIVVFFILTVLGGISVIFFFSFICVHIYFFVADSCCHNVMLHFISHHREISFSGSKIDDLCCDYTFEDALSTKNDTLRSLHTAS